ncbi:MAG: hypothetical protein K2X00_09840 [Nitrospiraceae bacterium]|nr:hypothetical protein [Nitrospiraceae bacterium]
MRSCIAADPILMELVGLPAPTPGERLRVLMDPRLCEAARIMVPGNLRIYRLIAAGAGVTLEELYLAFRVLYVNEMKSAAAQ